MPRGGDPEEEADWKLGTGDGGVGRGGLHFAAEHLGSTQYRSIVLLLPDWDPKEKGEPTGGELKGVTVPCPYAC